MYNNIGRKIKIFAVAICVIGLFASLVAGAVVLAFGKYFRLVGILVIVIGPLSAYLISCLLYGFGRLVENSDILVHKIGIMEEQMEPKSPEERLVMLRDWKDRGLITNDEYMYLLENESL